jgi:serine/threonine protein kinase
MTIARGQHLIGKKLGTCVLERLLGYGGTSAVFFAQEQERQVAVKVFLPRANLDARMQRDFYRRFLHEADSASNLHHSSILPIYSYGEEDGLPYIVMPYMSGGTLAEYCLQRGRLSLQEVQWYLEQLAAALDYAHEHGCVHCDVKPANMLLDSEGRVMLSDFGIARLTRTDEAAESAVAEIVMGTPDYISPEQALGRALDGRSDIYSLGVTVFFLLTKSLPFCADTPIALALLHVHEMPPALALMRGDITPAVDRVIQKALAKDPQERYQSACEFSTAFTVAVQASAVRRAPFRSEHGVSVNEDQPDLPTDTEGPVLSEIPTIRVTPVKMHKPLSRRLFLAVAVCLLLIVSGSLAFNYFSPGLPTSPSLAQDTATAIEATTDPLTNIRDWPTGKTLFFEEEPLRYHVINTLDESAMVAPYFGHPYQDFRLHVTMSRIRGADGAAEYYGVVFRADPDQTSYYVFEIDPADGGHYAFLRYDSQDVRWTMIKNGAVPGLVGRAGQANTLEVEARGNTFSFRVNNTMVGDTSVDASQAPLLTGLVGFYVEDKGVEVAFSQLRIDPL